MECDHDTGVMTSITALRNAQRLKCEVIRRAFKAYGLPWREGKLYDEGRLYFENGTPDQMWISLKSLALVELNRFIKVLQLSIVKHEHMYLDDEHCPPDCS